MTRSLADTFNPRWNSLNALRLILATLVIVSHSWPLAGLGDDPGFGDSNLGEWAVAGFFAVSGYLITASRLTSRSLTDYLWRRFLRIYPAYLVVILMVAFVFSPLSVLIDATANWTPGAASRYVVENIALHLGHDRVNGTLETVPFKYSWDGALWTLMYEFACYVVVGLAVSILRGGRLLTLGVVLLFAGSTIANFTQLAWGIEDSVATVRIFRLMAFFSAGAVLYLMRERIPLSGVLATGAAAALVVLAWLGAFATTGGLPLAYLLMYLGSVARLQKIGSKNDISYGMYIYAFPIQQLLALSFGKGLPLVVFISLSIVLTVPFAWASWLLIERHAMKLKRLTARREPDPEGHVQELAERQT